MNWLGHEDLPGVVARKFVKKKKKTNGILDRISEESPSQPVGDHASSLGNSFFFLSA